MAHIAPDTPIDRTDPDQLEALLDELAEYLLEAHQPEINDHHAGDEPDDCSYCRALRRAGLHPTPDAE